MRPELETGIRTARHLVTGNILDFVELSETIKMLEINIKPEWAGYTLRGLDLRSKEHINVIALRKNGELVVNPDPDSVLSPDLSMLVTVEKK